MKKLWQAFSYIRYRLRSKTRFKVHSPFVYELVEKVFRDKTKYEEYTELNKIRHKYIKRTDKVETLDLGALSGKKEYLVKLKVVGDIAKKSGHTKKQLEMLFRMARYFEPGSILEFGTSLGMSTIYMGKGCPEAKLITMEGSMGLATIAKDNFDKRGLSVELEVGDFDAILQQAVKNEEMLDMVFFDGNHRRQATLRYFNACMKKVGEKSVFIFDDIHWSPGMERAWNKIKADPRVSLTVDIYWAGMAFFIPGIAKQDFVIRY